MGIRLPMTPEPFEKAGLGDTLLGRTPAQHAFAKAKNAVIAGEFDEAIIAAIARESGIDVLGRFHDRWVELLEEVVTALGSDERYDGQEKEFIARYVRAFLIAREEAEGAVARAGRRIFKTVAARLITDMELSDADRDALYATARRLGVPRSDVDPLLAEVATPLMQTLIERLNADGLVSDTEWDELWAATTKLRLTADPNAPFIQELAMANRRWKVLHGPLQAHECPDLTLQRGERVFFRGDADWHEYRKVRQRVDYAGLTGRFRIARGLSFRYGSIGYRSPSKDELLLIRSGDLVMTNKRVILLSAIGDNKSIRWSSVVRVSMESHNTFELEKATGKSPVIDVKSASVGEQFLSAQMAYRLLEQSAE